MQSLVTLPRPFLTVSVKYEYFWKWGLSFWKEKQVPCLSFPWMEMCKRLEGGFNKSIHLQEQATDVKSPVKTYSAPSPTPPATVHDSLQQIWPWEQKTKRIKTWKPVKEDSKVIDPILAARNIKGIYKGEMYKVDLNPIQIQLRGKSFSKPNMETDITLSWGARHQAVIWELFWHWHSCLATGNFSRFRGKPPSELK